MTSLKHIIESDLGRAVAENPARFDAMIATQLVTMQSMPKSYRETMMVGFAEVVTRMLASNRALAFEIIGSMESDMGLRRERGTKRGAESSGKVNVAEVKMSAPRRRLIAPRPLVSPVGNYGQDQVSESCRERLSRQSIAAATASAFALAAGTSVLVFCTNIFQKYKTETLFFLGVALVTAFYFAAPGMLATLVPHLVGMASRSVVTTLLAKYPVFSPDKEVGLGTRAIGIALRATLFAGLYSCTTAMSAASNTANAMSQFWRAKYSEQERVSTEAALNVATSTASRWIPFWGSTGQATDAATAEVSNISADITDAASEFTYQTGAPITEASLLLARVLASISCVLEIIPWETEGKKTARYMRSLEETMQKMAPIIQRGEIAVSTGTYRGYARIEQFYHDANVRLLSQGSFTLLMGGDLQDIFSSLSGACSWAWAKMRGKIHKPVAEVVESEKKSWTMSFSKFKNTQTFKVGIYVVLPILVQQIPSAAAAVVSSFAQDRRRKKHPSVLKKQPSAFNRRVARELSAYKTKAKSAEEQQKRMARCSRRVSKQMKAEARNK